MMFGDVNSKSPSELGIYGNMVSSNEEVGDAQSVSVAYRKAVETSGLSEAVPS